LQEEFNKNQRILGLEKNNERALKLMSIDKRNLLTSAVNYNTHPQIENL
jgi:hypothetical protein